MSSSSVDSLNKVWDVQALKHMPQSDVALDMLNRLVKATDHILRGRKWKVKVLREFYPSNQNLLGMSVIMIIFHYGHHLPSLHHREVT